MWMIIIGSTSLGAVNNLMQQFGNKATPLSKYILFRAYERCHTTDFASWDGKYFIRGKLC
jgi:hypothetical protein